MTWCFAFGWLQRVWQRRRQRRAARPPIQTFRPWPEPLEDRLMLDNNVWLPQQLAPSGGTTQLNPATPLFRPATTNFLPDLALQSTTLTATGSVSLTDNGAYSLTLTQSGPYDQSGDRYTFTESGLVSFSLVELGDLSAAGYSINSVVLTQTASLSWELVETDSGGQTLQDQSGTSTVTAQADDSAPLDPFFVAGFNWLSLTQQLSSLNSLGLANLAAV